MARPQDFGPRDGEGYVAFHARLFETAEQVMAHRPEQPAKARIDALAFEPAAFGTVPGAAAAASRTAGWTEQTQTQIARVGAEVADLEVVCRTVKVDAQASGDLITATAGRVDVGID